jgi:uncharacterized membrane protein YdjX (TVP38/TMEM64 family)
MNIKKLWPLLVILAAAIFGFVFLGDYLSFETLRDNREALLALRDNNYLTTAAVFIGIYIVIVSFSLPGAAIASLTGGFLFGIWAGTLFNISAATIGAIVIFQAARMGLGDALAKKMEASEGAVKSIKDGIHENEVSYLFLMRLVPAVPFFVANLIPALVGVSFRNFALTTFFGIIPGGFVYTWVGAGLSEVFNRGESPNLGIIFEPQILGPILGLSALAALPIALKIFKKKKAET